MRVLSVIAIVFLLHERKGGYAKHWAPTPLRKGARGIGVCPEFGLNDGGGAGPLGMRKLNR